MALLPTTLAPVGVGVCRGGERTLEGDARVKNGFVCCGEGMASVEKLVRDVACWAEGSWNGGPDDMLVNA